MPFRVVCLVVLASLSLSAQSQPQQHPKPAWSTMSDFRAGLAESRLQKCEQKLKEINDWYAENEPQYQQLIKDKRDLTARNEELEQLTSGAYVLLAAAFGGGMALAAALVYGIVRLWRKSAAMRLTANHKQLIALLMGCAWITVAVIVALQNERLLDHPVNLLVAVIVYSAPAILFGGVSFWWFGKEKEKGQSTNV